MCLCLQGIWRVDPYQNYVAASVNWAPFCGCPFNKSPILGSILGPLLFGNFQVAAEYISRLLGLLCPDFLLQGLKRASIYVGALGAFGLSTWGKRSARGRYGRVQ